MLPKTECLGIGNLSRCGIGVISTVCTLHAEHKSGQRPVTYPHYNVQAPPPHLQSEMQRDGPWHMRVSAYPSMLTPIAAELSVAQTNRTKSAPGGMVLACFRRLTGGRSRQLRSLSHN